MLRSLLSYFILSLFLFISVFSFEIRASNTRSLDFNNVVLNDNQQDPLLVDSLLFKTLVDSFANYIYSEPNKALVFANSYLKNAENLKNASERSHFLSKGYNLKGVVFNYKYSYDSALYFYDSAIYYANDYGDNYKIAEFNNNASLTAQSKRDQYKKIDYLTSALNAIEKELVNDSSLKFINLYESILVNFGDLYLDQNKLDQAIFYYKEALSLYHYGLTNKEKYKIYNNIGLLYRRMINYDSALFYYEKSLSIIEQDAQKLSTISNIAGIYIKMEDYKLALNQLNIAKDLADTLNLSEPSIYNNFGIVYDSLYNPELALDYYEKTYEEAVLKNNLKFQYFSSKNLYYKYKLNNEFKKALRFHKEYILLRDSLEEMEALELTLKMDLERKYELKQQQDSIKNIEREKLNETKLSLQKTQIKEQRNFTIGIVVLILAIVVFAILISIKYKESVKQRKIITAQKIEVDNAYGELEKNKKVLEKKNSELMDSINYAKYIQRALLPDEKEIEAFFGNEFVFNWPKDVVGGDFHWFKSYGNQAIIVAADCTGHGVPGGFVTMLGSLLIEKSVKNQPKNPNEILSDINRGIVTLLKQHKEDAIQDGMDIAICLVDKENKKIKFSGSRNGVHIVDLENIVSYKGDLTPVGGYFSHTNNFTERKYEIKEIQLEDGQWVFMYSDGFYDQFGGPKNKSMGSNRFKQILQEAVTMNKTSSPDFKNYFFEWMGDQEQIDDVLVIGFKI